MAFNVATHWMILSLIQSPICAAVIGGCAPICSLVANDILSKYSSSLRCQYNYFTPPDPVRASSISDLKRCLIFTIPTEAASHRSPAIANDKEQTGVSYTFTICAFYDNCTVSSSGISAIFFLFLFSF